MSIDGRTELRHFAESLLGAFLVAASDKLPAQREALAQAAKDFLESPDCAKLIDHFMETLVRATAHELAQERRADPFRRLLCHPLTDLLDRGALSRSLLGNYFSFLHLVLGDAQDQATEQCQSVIDHLQADQHFSWDNFYEDERAKQILWGVLLRIAETFKRFQPRRDWFIGLMQNRTHAVSLGAHSFMPLARREEEDLAPFAVAEFNLMFGALFRPLLNLPARDQGAFTRQFGAPPVVLIGPLVEKLVEKLV